MSAAWSGGSTRAHRKVRAVVLERDAWLCQLKLDGVCTIVANCVHHTRGKEETGNDPAFMVASCTPCNLRAGDPRVNTRSRQVVEWVRAQGYPVRLAVIARAWPGVAVAQILMRAIQRGEIVRGARGVYGAGPVEPPSTLVGDPAPRPITKW